MIFISLQKGHKQLENRYFLLLLKWLLAPVSQWDKRWPAKVVVQTINPRRGWFFWRVTDVPQEFWWPSLFMYIPTPPNPVKIPLEAEIFAGTPVTPWPIETPVTRYKHRINVIITPVNGRFAQNVSLRRPYQVRILLFLCLQINISAKVKS